ncbi:MAG TPA: hypothetical protein PKJ33_02190 [Alphaproteobacteria bacterium]|nr:hypothetical protein [Alphaproteobacteria bacterium]
MKKVSIYLLAGFAPFSSAFAVDFPAGNNVQPLSKYGEIQNVSNYSSNPNWNHNGAYNQTMPTPVYVQGAAVSTEECQSLVSGLVASGCSMQNNCVGVKLNDIKPTIMVQLSQMPEHNYVSACGGYIDSAFNSYVLNQGVVVKPVTFPNAVFPGSNSEQEDFKIKNPYAMKYPEWNGEKWFQGIVDRSQELGALQAKNAEDTTLVATDMPKTAADMTFEQKIANSTEGYEQWKAKYEWVEDSDGKRQWVCTKNCAYQTLSIESTKSALQRESEELTKQKEVDKLKMTRDAYCKKYQQEPECNENKNSTYTNNNTGSIKVKLKGFVKK